MHLDSRKILIIAESANPEWVSVPLVGWSMSKAIRDRIKNVHIITQVRNREAFIRAGLIEGVDFTAIDSEKIAAAIYRIGQFFRGDAGKAWTVNTAFNVISYYCFERLVWRKFSKQIKHNEYAIIHRVTPLTPTYPSLLAKKCNATGVPFVMGPLNGGVPWPKWFNNARRQEREWLSYFRSLYKWLPGYRSSLKSASAIIAGSLYTKSEFPSKFEDKLFYIPENGIDLERFKISCRPYREKLKICFVGRLVPYKGADILLEAALPFLKAGRLHIDIIGDGPMMPLLQSFIQMHAIENSVTMLGWVKHTEIQAVMCNSQMLGFPSIREFGGGVVLEAMALGIVPLVVNYAGPGELVDEQVGFKVPIGSRDSIVESIRQVIQRVIDNPSQLDGMSAACKLKIQSSFTWEAKAAQVESIYRWVLQSQHSTYFPKPIFFNKPSQHS